MGNSPDVTMCFIGYLLGSQCGFRLEDHPQYTVWSFPTLDAAGAGVRRFRTRTSIELPCYVPGWMRHMFLLDVCIPSTTLHAIC